MISVLFQIASHYPVNRLLLKEKITQALSTAVRRDAEVSVCVIGDGKMRQLNNQYRGKDYATDVLSFPLSESSQPGIAFIGPPDDVLRLGDIVISYPQAVREATEQNKMVDDIVTELALHGLNHLLGIHHPE